MAGTPEMFGLGAGGGILGALATYLGFKGRLDALERKAAAASEAAQILQGQAQALASAGMVTKSTCDAVQIGLQRRFESMEARLEEHLKIIEHQIGRVECRLNSLTDKR